VSRSTQSSKSSEDEDECSDIAGSPSDGSANTEHRI
jgi:hypothetical protein